MPKSPTRKLPPQPNEQPELRRRNIYDYDGEYEFVVARHWIAAEAKPVPEKARLP